MRAEHGGVPIRRVAFSITNQESAIHNDSEIKDHEIKNAVNA
jgi:hypothetical protein